MTVPILPWRWATRRALHPTSLLDQPAGSLVPPSPPPPLFPPVVAVRPRCQEEEEGSRRSRGENLPFSSFPPSTCPPPPLPSFTLCVCVCVCVYALVVCERALNRRVSSHRGRREQVVFLEGGNTYTYTPFCCLAQLLFASSHFASLQPHLFLIV